MLRTSNYSGAGRYRYAHEQGGNMSTTRNGEVDIHYEMFGDPNAPTLLLVNGL